MTSKKFTAQCGIPYATTNPELIATKLLLRVLSLLPSLILTSDKVRKASPSSSNTNNAPQFSNARWRGRLSKWKGDYSLLAGLIDDAEIHYAKARDVLASQKDSFWQAGSYLGMIPVTFTLLFVVVIVMFLLFSCHLRINSNASRGGGVFVCVFNTHSSCYHLTCISNSSVVKIVLLLMSFV